MDGKEISLASKELDKLEESGKKSGKGIKSAESSMESLADSSAKAGKSVKGASDAVENLGDSGARTSKGLKSVDGAMDGLADSSADASSSVKGVSDSLNNMSDNATGAANSTKKAKEEAASLGEESDKATGNTKKFALALGLVAIASAAFTVLKSSMDSAISRFDTLNKFPKVLQALGVSAEDSEKAMTRLSDGIDGLPTTLDDIASTAQRMYTSFGNMDRATDSALALNNALLAQGSNAGQAQRGTEQYLKALQTGQMDMNTWNTLQETMDIGLIKIAESFGFVGDRVKDDLYKALQDGTITLDQFNDKLIELGTGTGELANLAKVNSLGIATSLGNLRNAAARGVAGMLDSFNKLTRDVTGKEIAENIDSLKVIVNQSFKFMGSVIESTTPYVVGFSSAVRDAMPVVKALTPALVGMASAYTIHKVITLTTSALVANTTAVAVATTAKNVYAVATNRLALALALSAVQMKVSSAAILTYNKVIALTTATQAMMASGMSLTAIAAVGLSGAVHILNVAIKVLLGPIGWATLALGALVGAVVGVVKWFNRASEDSKRLSKETEDLGNANDELKNSLDNSSKAYKDNQREIENTAANNKDLIKRIEELSEKENKSVGDKQLLKTYIDELNGSITDMNLAYDEEADALNLSSEQIQARVVYMKEEEKLLSARERQVEISREQEEVEGQLAETIAKKTEVENNSNLSKSEAKELSEQLTEKERELEEALSALAVQQADTEEQMTASQNKIAEAVESGNTRQITSYEQLEGATKEAFDSMKSSYDSLVENATNAFDRMSEESKVSAEEMIANLEHNQRMTEEWGKNVASLYERAGKEGNEGFIQWLESMGPESAAELAVVSDMSDSELTRFIQLMNEGGTVASQSLKDSLGEGFDEVVDVMINFVDDGSKTLKDQIKSADFKSIGIAIPEGVEKGVADGTKGVIKASSEMAKGTSDAFKTYMDINSPSRRFKGYGTNITEGLVLGINEGTSAVLDAIRKMLQAIQKESENNFKLISKNQDSSVKEIEKSFTSLKSVTQTGMKNMLDRVREGANRQKETMRDLAKGLLNPFSNTPSQFYSIGLNSMSGLNSGLNAGRSMVLSTARNIANQVVSTMKSALRIHSPSRLMRDDVGRFIPEGIAVGIKENAKSVYKELDILSKNMVLISTPEQALGTTSMAYASTGGYLANAWTGNPSTPAQANQNTGSNLTGLITAIEKLASRPISVAVEGREIIKATHELMTKEQEFFRGRENSFRGGTY
ncbi:tape measure protein [Sutcliffiella horikoshii]|uniref:tape measure protein n=1 Tax=Sutcliffiella horikoshii TaxID=79883 RepID=UPI00203D61A8|nr:tape measure protein [Sutcliffiella horikoshii]